MSFDSFRRVELLTGGEGLSQLNDTKVILFGVGGVGSWCAESLVRSGIGHLTIVDFDTLSDSNINRQLQATTKTIDEVKVETLAKRLREISPTTNIIALHKKFSNATAHEFKLENFDYVIDAIDSLDEKVNLIEQTLKLNLTLFSSLGAALRIDSSRIKIAKLKKTKDCTLAKQVRIKARARRLKMNHYCVYSEELLESYEEEGAEEKIGEDGLFMKRPLGSLVHITAIFGFKLAELVITSALAKCENGIKKIR
jgi:tRNA A37 threonylcarbamoyladenosine dehydratase